MPETWKVRNEDVEGKVFLLENLSAVAEESTQGEFLVFSLAFVSVLLPNCGRLAKHLPTRRRDCDARGLHRLPQKGTALTMSSQTN